MEDVPRPAPPYDAKSFWVSEEFVSSGVKKLAPVTKVRITEGLRAWKDFESGSRLALAWLSCGDTSSNERAMEELSRVLQLWSRYGIVVLMLSPPPARGDTLGFSDCPGRFPGFPPVSVISIEEFKGKFESCPGEIPGWKRTLAEPAAILGNFLAAYSYVRLELDRAFGRSPFLDGIRKTIYDLEDYASGLMDGILSVAHLSGSSTFKMTRNGLGAYCHSLSRLLSNSLAWVVDGMCRVNPEVGAGFARDVLDVFREPIEGSKLSECSDDNGKGRGKGGGGGLVVPTPGPDLRALDSIRSFIDLQVVNPVYISRYLVGLLRSIVMNVATNEGLLSPHLSALCLAHKRLVTMAPSAHDMERDVWVDDDRAMRSFLFFIHLYQYAVSGHMEKVLKSVLREYEFGVKDGKPQAAEDNFKVHFRRVQEAKRILCYHMNDTLSIFAHELVKYQ